MTWRAPSSTRPYTTLPSATRLRSRTGRAGNVGEAFSLVCNDELGDLRGIVKLLGKPLATFQVDGFEAGTGSSAADPSDERPPRQPQGRRQGHGGGRQDQGQRRASNGGGAGGQHRSATNGSGANGRSNGVRGSGPQAPRAAVPRDEHGDRSEEHTSELQSLMRISYAVFCLKKKKKITTANYAHNFNDK